MNIKTIRISFNIDARNFFSKLNKKYTCDSRQRMHFLQTFVKEIL